MKITYFRPQRDETNFKILIIGSNIRDNMLCALFPSYLFLNKRKPSKMPHIYLLMLDANNDNS